MAYVETPYRNRVLCLMLSALLAVACSWAWIPLAWADEESSAAAASSEAAVADAAASSGASASADDEALNEGENNVVDPTQRADNSFIYDTTIGAIIEQSSLYNGRTVQVIGEAIGDRIVDTRNPSRCWVTLGAIEEGATGSVFVLLSNEQANQIDHYGRYGVTGTTLQVRGTFYQACAEHDGQADLHATEVSVMVRGVEHPDQFNPEEFLPGIIAVIIGAAILWAFNFARERTR